MGYYGISVDAASTNQNTGHRTPLGITRVRGRDGRPPRLTPAASTNCWSLNTRGISTQPLAGALSHNLFTGFSTARPRHFPEQHSPLELQDSPSARSSQLLTPPPEPTPSSQPYKAHSPALSSAEIMAGLLLQDETEGYMVAPNVLECPNPSPWPISCTCTASI